VTQELSHPERFDPHGQDGTLIDTEHRGRYWWAARAVEGREVLDAGCGTGYGMEILAAGGASVTGVDVDRDAVVAAGRRVGDPDAVVEGDVRELPFDDDAFDVVVCWEVIEHVEGAARALGEFRRVLRPGGLLLVSSPNPRVYPPGNEHHVHEYPPEELAAAVGEHFPNVASYRQHPWLASVIEPLEGAPGVGEVRASATLDPGAEAYGILAASDAELPSMPRVVALGQTFEVRWWSERVEAVEEDARVRSEAVEAEARDRLAVVENDARHGLARAEAAEASALDRLRAVGGELLEANQLLARLPLLEQRAEELRVERDGLAARLLAIEGSRSWRLAAPLRRLRRVLRP
jgi:SAM-dependent methyltransferase